MSFISDIVNYMGTDFVSDFSYDIGTAIGSSSFFSNLSNITHSFYGLLNPDTGGEKSDFTLPITADSENVIPVIYGSAWIKGSLVDARMGSTGCEMYYAIVLCEKTGNLLSSGAASAITIDEVWWGDKRVSFSGNNATVESSYNADGTAVSSINGKVSMWSYANGSAVAGNIGGTADARSIMPGWTGAHTMDALAFVIFKVEYSDPTSVTGLENVTFKVSNSMSLPGDVLYDYMTSARYGAGIATGDIDI